MSQNLVELFQQTINNKLNLSRTGRVWSLSGTPQITMKAFSRHSLGFSLDSNPSLFNSFFEGSPPLDITKMCDAIIVLSHKGTDYIFVIEQKTRHKGDYKKQLVNGKYFCDWLLVLLKEHNHYNEKVVFIGLLCWSPREKSPRKGGTRHEKIKSIKKPDSRYLFFDVKNETDIRLARFI